MFPAEIKPELVAGQERLRLQRAWAAKIMSKSRRINRGRLRLRRWTIGNLERARDAVYWVIGWGA